MSKTVDGHDFEADVCPHCRFNLKAWRRLPAWCQKDVVFALDGAAYRVVNAEGSSNRIHYPHFADVARCQPVTAPPWMGLPDAPATVADVSASLRILFAMPVFSARELARAIHRVPA